MSSWHDNSSQAKMIRMGYWISEKKSKKLDIERFTDFCRNAGVELVKLDLERPIGDQGPFDLIFHKLTDILAKVNVGNERARQQIENFMQYTASHPEVVIVDPLDNLQKLMDRRRTYQFVTECQVVERDYQYFTPSFVEFTSMDVETNKQLMEQYDVQFPFICKPSVAHGSSQCHQMAIIFNEEGLKDIQPPCVAQTFINHNAVLYKIFIIGKQHFVVPRPSLKNFAAGDHKTIHFDSAVVSKPYSCGFLNMLDDEDVSDTLQRAPDPGCLEHLCRQLQSRLGLDLIGVDVIIENHTGRYAVIDINAFPGYENGIDHLYNRLINVFLDKLDNKRKAAGDLSVNDTIPQPEFVDQSGLRPQQEVGFGRTADRTSAPVDRSGQELSSSNEHTKNTSTMSSKCPVAPPSSGSNPETNILSFVDMKPSVTTTTNNNCKENLKDKQVDQIMFCNHRNYPVSTPTTGPDADTLIWEELLCKDAKSKDNVVTTPANICKWNLK